MPVQRRQQVQFRREPQRHLAAGAAIDYQGREIIGEIDDNTGSAEVIGEVKDD